jgi:AcrR family transcriptional regulator
VTDTTAPPALSAPSARLAGSPSAPSTRLAGSPSAPSTRLAGSPSAFQRARSPEQKALRRAAILDAARRLAVEHGVRNVSLGDIAKAVGLTKSNVLRYFETREDIYLQLAADGYRVWTEWVIERLRGAERFVPAELAAALAEGLANDPLFCDLLSDAPASLEHNVSTEAVRTFKYAVVGAMDQLAGVLTNLPAGLSPAQARDVLVGTTVLATGLWPWSNPPPVLASLYATDPPLRQAKIEFAPEVRRLTEALINGVMAPVTQQHSVC